jgi:hypothetical protein
LFENDISKNIGVNKGRSGLLKTQMHALDSQGHSSVPVLIHIKNPGKMLFGKLGKN